MKKTYEKPELRTEQFDVEDVITFLQTVADQFENLIDNLSDMLGGLGH